jgi:CMP-N,N'-diacetyllegionaminic acid synthase
LANASVRVLGVIPARAGSKRVPNKNLRIVAGRPLIAWTIEAAAKAESLTTFVVSTECQNIADVALSCGAYVVKRDEELATDKATSGAVCKSALEWMGPENFDFVALLHPTSPVRNPKHIDQAVRMLADSTAPALASVSHRKRTYTHNASLYVMRSDWLMETVEHYCDESIPFLMDEEHSIDIDTELGLKVAGMVLDGRTT